jgi:hypothetical protein
MNINNQEDYGNEQDEGDENQNNNTQNPATVGG